MNAQHYDNALHMMESFGGSFVKSLANCYYCADSTNKQRLRAAFPEVFERYERHFADWKRNKAAEELKAQQERKFLSGPYTEDDDTSHLMGG